MNEPEPKLAKSAGAPDTVLYAALEFLPPYLVGELIDGEVAIKRLPPPLESMAASTLSYELSRAHESRRGSLSGWIFLNKPEVHLGEHVLVPDLAGWRQEHLTPLPDTPYVKVAPDWVCEVLGPGTVTHDRGSKRRIYAEAGVPHLWLLDPRIRLLEVFALTDGKWRLLETFSDSDWVSAPPFDAVSFSLGVLSPFDIPAEASTQDKSEG